MAKCMGARLKNFFKTPAAEISCQNSGSTFTGSDANGTATSIILSASYKDCSVGGLPMTIIMNGCTYNLDQPESEGGSHTTWRGTVDLVCPAGKVIEFEILLGGTITAHNTKICTYTILPVNNLGSFTYYNIAGVGGKKDDVTVTADVGNIPVEAHGAACPDGNTKPVVAIYKSSITLSGKNPAGAEDDAWISTD